jgi:hypothetical protein
MPTKIRACLIGIVFACGVGCNQTPKNPTGGEGSGSHGGDPIKLLFSEARMIVLSKLDAISEAAFNANMSADVAAWFIQNHVDLAEDVRLSPHRWTEEPRTYCASTNMERHAPIYFSAITCRERIWTAEDAVKILVHESTHHLGVDSEERADQLAVAFSSLRGAGFWAEWNRDDIPDLARGPSDPFYVGGRLILTGRSETPQCSGKITASGYDIWTNKWVAISPPGNLTDRRESTVAGLGSRNQVLYWGGVCRDGSSENFLADGFIYDPIADSWETTENTGAPAPRANALSSFANGEVFIWGGRDVSGWRADGGMYSLASKSWRVISSVGAPPSMAASRMKIRYLKNTTSTLTRNKFAVTSTDKNVVTLHLYTPENDSWETIVSSPGPIDMDSFESLIHWNDSDLYMFIPTLPATTEKIRIAGVVWSPASNQWRQISAENAPAERSRASLVWTGERFLAGMEDLITAPFIIYGGSDPLSGSVFADSSVYYPATDRWEAISSEKAPSERFDAYTVWTGARMLVWGGRNNALDPIPIGGILSVSLQEPVEKIPDHSGQD